MLAASVLMWLFGADIALAEVYKWQDKEGRERTQMKELSSADLLTRG